MMVIVNFIYYSVPCPSIICKGLFLLKIIPSSHLVPQGYSYLVTYFWESEVCAGMVKAAGPPMNSSAAL